MVSTGKRHNRLQRLLELCLQRPVRGEVSGVAIPHRKLTPSEDDLLRARPGRRAVTDEPARSSMSTSLSRQRAPPRRGWALAFHSGRAQRSVAFILDSKIKLMRPCNLNTILISTPARKTSVNVPLCLIRTQGILLRVLLYLSRLSPRKARFLCPRHCH